MARYWKSKIKVVETTGKVDHSTLSRKLVIGRVAMGTYVLVHGAWHTGKELEPVATVINAAGHSAYTPTINREPTR